LVAAMLLIADKGAALPQAEDLNQNLEVPPRKRPALTSSLSPIIHRLSPSRWTTFTQSNSGLPGNAIAALAVGPKGKVWVGTYGRGAARFDGVGWLPVAPRLGIGDTWVTAVAVGPDGTAWLGTYGAGLSRFDGQRWTTFQVENSGLPNNWVTALTVAPDGAVWIGTYGGGVACFDGRGWRVFTRRKDGLASDWVTSIAVTPDGQVWVGTHGEGLSRFRPSPLEREIYSVTSTLWWGFPGSLQVAEAIARGRFGALALLGLELELQAGGVWERITAARGLPSDFVNDIAVDPAGSVWVATDSGVARFDGRSWKTFTRDDGLPDNGVRTVAVGRDGQVWIGTPRGAARFDGQVWQIFTHAQGLAHDAVEAIAVDPTGNVWFGTLGGLTRFSQSPISNLQSLIPNPQSPRLPVIFIHGWTPPPGDTLEHSSFRFMARWLSRDGFPVFYATRIRPEQTLYANARRLRAVIDAVKRETGAEKVILIGHSMGGLNVRAYTETTLYQGDVAAVFTLGSPHAGVYLWRDLLVREITSGNTQPSTRELLPEHMALFNHANANSHRVPYYLVAGDVTHQEMLDFLRFWPPNDGLITVWSALALEGPSVRRIITEDAHAWSKRTILLGLPSYLWPQDFYLSLMRPVLTSAPTRPYALPQPLTNSWELMGTHGSWEISPPSPENRTPLRFGDLDPKAKVRLRLSVDEARQVRFTVLWRWGALGVRLFDPADRTLEPDDEGVERFDLATGTFANLTVIQVENPTPGIWTLELDGSDLEKRARYLAYAAMDGPLRLTAVDPPAWVAPGSAIPVTATLTVGGEPVRGAAITARVIWPDGTSEILALHDDGTHADGEAGDGVYGNTVVVPTAAGYAPVTIEAQGVWRSIPFARGTTAVITVASLAGRLVADARFVATPQPHIEVDVDIARGGEFGVSVTLVDGEGAEVLRTTHPVRLEEGRHTVAVPVDTALLAGHPAPFRVTQTLLLDLAGAAVPVSNTQ